MYHVGLALEIDAKQHLGKYYTTKLVKHLIVYRQVIRQALEMIKRSFNRGYFPARLDVLRIEQEIDLNERTILTSTVSNSSTFSNKEVTVIGLFLIAIILGIVLAIYLVSYQVPSTQITNYLNNQYAYMLPYEVIDNQPTVIPSGVGYPPKIIKVQSSITKELLVNELIGQLKLEYEREPKTRIRKRTQNCKTSVGD